MGTFVSKLRGLVFGAVTDGVEDAKPQLQENLAALRANAAEAIKAGVEDALAEIHGLLDDAAEKPAPSTNRVAALNGRNRSHAAAK